MEYNYRLNYICLEIEEIMTHINKYIKRPITKIIKIFKYIPILWKDEDWDSDYLLYLIDFKLKRMYKKLHRDDLVVREELDKMLSTIMETQEHIYNYINASEVYEEKVEKPLISTTFRFEKLNNGCSRLVSVNADTGEDLTEEDEKIYRDWLKRLYEYENQEWDNIWNTIKEHGRSWWD